ncbi:MAG: hypothetical protein HFH60_03760 [Lachnospiraceae bacterium]|jgi:predicted ribosomally synthesized peptide with SipW-like signal peptide|nr:hypothetical protein [Lachnospiraceae bacterium]
MKNKFALKLAAVVCATVLITAGTLSYFSDSVKTSASATAGSLDVEVTSSISGKQFLLPGKAYGFGTTVYNRGNKSADVRMVVTLESDDGTIFEGDRSIVDLWEKINLDENNVPYEGAFPYPKTVVDKNTVRYETFLLESTLNGSDSFTEREIEDGVDTDEWTPDAYLYIGDYSGTNASYVKMTVDFYAIQHRNTNKYGQGNWELVDTFEIVN